MARFGGNEEVVLKICRIAEIGSRRMVFGDLAYAGFE
jgi:hypothetical protein